MAQSRCAMRAIVSGPHSQREPGQARTYAEHLKADGGFVRREAALARVEKRQRQPQGTVRPLRQPNFVRARLGKAGAPQHRVKGVALRAEQNAVRWQPGASPAHDRDVAKRARFEERRKRYLLGGCKSAL